MSAAASFSIALGLLIATAFPARSDSDAMKLATDCLALFSSGSKSQAEAAAREVAAWTGQIGPAAMSNGTSCLNQVLGPSWQWSTKEKRFLNPSESAEANAEKRAADSVLAMTEGLEQELHRKADQQAVLRAKAQTALLERRIVAVQRTFEACSTLLSRDEVAALTNPVCSAIFLAQGLPE